MTVFPLSLIDSLRDSNENYFQKLVHQQAFQEWKESLRSTMFEDRFKDITEVLELRDICEDILENEYYITKAFALPKEIFKVTNRSALASAALHNHIITHASLDRQPLSVSFIDFVLVREAQQWLEFTDPKITLRPRFKLLREDLDELLSTIESQFMVCNKVWVKMWSIKLGYPDSIVPILGILYAIANQQDLDDLFIDCPGPQVLGAPCNYREVSTEPIQVKAKKQTVNYDRFILATNGKLHCYSNKKWNSFPEPLAQYIAIVPGLDLNVQIEQGPAVRKYLIVAKDSTAAIMALTYGPNGYIHVARKVEFDLCETIDYLDCQRDRDNNIIVLFGQLNHNIGSLKTINYCGWTEEEFIQRKQGTIEPKRLLNRMAQGSRIDFRDHGNLLALVNNTTESTEPERQFHFEQSIFYGASVLPSKFEKQIYAVYGSPLHYIAIVGNQVIECTTENKTVVPIDVCVPSKMITSVCIDYF